MTGQIFLGAKKQYPAIDRTIVELKKKGLVLKIEDDFHDYLSCEIVFSEDRKKAWLGQPHLTQKLEKNLEMKLRNSRNTKLLEHLVLIKFKS